MNLFGMPLISAGLGQRKPNPHGIRQPLRHQMLIAKHLTLFFFFLVSLDEFHWISHITFAKEAWQILETTYKGTKQVKDTKLQMLTTRFEELRMSEDKSFDSFYSKMNEVVIDKFNLGEQTEDSKEVRKIL